MTEVILQKIAEFVPHSGCVIQTDAAPAFSALEKENDNPQSLLFKHGIKIDAKGPSEFIEEFFKGLDLSDVIKESGMF